MFLNKHLLPKLLLPVFVFALVKTTYAQDTSANKTQLAPKYLSTTKLPPEIQDSLSDLFFEIKNDPHGKGQFPSVLLVQLGSEQNRIAALEKNKNYKLLDEVRKDAAGTRSATIKDFEKNFKYCTVYYFIDTNRDLVKEGQFDGILLDAGGKLVKPGIKGNYLVAYYGYLSGKYRPWENAEDSLRRETDVETPFGKGLIITDEKLRILNYYYKQNYNDVMLEADKNYDSTKNYRSRHFDIEYFPFAKHFNEDLGKENYRVKLWKNYIRYKYRIKRFRASKLPKSHIVLK